MKTFSACSLSLALLLVACGSEPDVPRETGDAAEAEGEVLGGSISDEMIPLGALKSQSPPLKEAPKASGGSETSGDTDESAETAEEQAEAADAAPAEDTAEEEG